MPGLRSRLRLAARRAALGGAGAAMVVVGLAFLTAALALYLWTVTDPITACLILGLGYAGLGLILIFAPGGRTAAPRPAPPPDKTAQAEMPPIAAAFVQGMNQGIAVGARRGTR